MFRFKNWPASFALLLIISCSIVKDSDITSLAQFSSLKLKSFEIDIAASLTSGGNSSVLAKLDYDSAIDIPGSQTVSGYHITRFKGYSLPPLSFAKMKLRSDTKVKTEIQIYYRDDGLPVTFFINVGTSWVELYRFFYNTDGQVSQVRTRIVFSAGDTLKINDNVSYPSPYAPGEGPSSIVRTSSSTGPISFSLVTGSPSQFTGPKALAGTFTPQSCSNCGSGTMINQLNFALASNLGQPVYQVNFNNNCNDNQNLQYSCGGSTISYFNNGSGGPNGSGQNQLNFQNNATLNKTLQTTLTSQDHVDYYYFHPIMLLRDAIPQGGFYFWFYSIDWFHASGTSVSNDDFVKIKFNYAQ